jgi:hypothetical protein
MKLRGRRLLAIWLIALITIGGGFAASAQNQSVHEDRPPLGPVIISPQLGHWNDFQRPIMRASQFDLVKVHLPPGYGTGPDHVRDLISDGAQIVMLKTEDCASDAPTTLRHLTTRGFLDLIEEHPHIEFVVQVGNEPERCTAPLSAYFQNLFDVITEVRPVVDQPNLSWVAGLPMSPDDTRAIIADGWILDLYDGVGTNMLGHFSLVDEYHGWHEIVDYVLDSTDATLWITEIGINHPPMDKAEKARRILEYVDQLPADRVGGVAIFTLGQGTRWPQYEVTERMVPVFAGLDDDNCRFFAPTEHFLCGSFHLFWERHGGLPIFGYPITAAEPADEGELVQFMERARFEWHPGVWPAQFDVLLGHLGWDMVQERTDEPYFQSVGSTESDGEDCVYFPETGQHLCDEFLIYWNTFGGLPVFGFPISQEFEENGFRVQYFERTRFEHQPGVWPERFNVLQGLLGVQAVEGTLVQPPDDDDDLPSQDDSETSSPDESED